MLVTVSNVWRLNTPLILAATEAADDAALTGTVEIQNIMAAVEAADAASFAGGITATGALAATEASDAASFAAALPTAPIVVTAIGTGISNATTAVITVPAGGVPAGSLIVVGVCTEWGNALSSVTDTAGNTYVRARASGALGAPYVDTWYCKNCLALVAGNTIVTTMSNGFRQRSSALYATNVDLTAPLDQAPTATHGTSATPSITSGALAVSGELVIGWLGTTSARVVTQDADFAAPPMEENSLGTWGIYGGHRIVGDTAAQTYNPTLSNSQTWSEVLLTFKPAA